MKNIGKLLRTAVLSAVILSSMAACDRGDDNKDDNGPAHYTGILKIKNLQVYEGTDSNIVSKVYEEFEGEREISVNVYCRDGDGSFSPAKNIGSGRIKEGLLSCEVPEPGAGDLIEWNDFKYLFLEWEGLDCVPKTKGAYLRFVTSENEWLNREKMSGSSDSVWLESIWFVYTDTDCRITGTPGKGIRPDAFYETAENLDLQLESGWNTVCRKQLLKGDRGIEADSMKLKNPNDFKWVIRPQHP